MATALTAIGLFARISPTLSAIDLRSPQPTAQVTDVQVPLLTSVFYSGSLATASGDLVVGDLTSSTVCRLANVDPSSMRVISNRDTPCTNPQLVGESVMPVESLAAPKSNIGLVRIATTTRAAGGVHVGPVVMRYQNDSASLPEWTYGGGYLWLYDTALTSGAASIRRPAELLRIGISTGQISATIAVPSLPLVELAADADGLWMARSQDTSWSGSKPPALLYFVGAGSRSPQVVVKNGDYATWLAAAGHSAWATLVGANSGTEVTDSFNAPTAKPHVVTVGSKTIVPIETGQEPFDAQPVLVDSNRDLFFITKEYSTKSSTSIGTYEQIFEFDPSKGTESKIASLHTARGSLQAAVVYEGSLYLLIGGQSLSATLFRVHP